MPRALSLMQMEKPLQWSVAPGEIGKQYGESVVTAFSFTALLSRRYKLFLLTINLFKNHGFVGVQEHAMLRMPGHSAS